MDTLSQEKVFPSGARLQVVEGDLLTQPVDAIVNAANAHLQHGGGVAGAIARQGGPQIQAESDAWVSKHGPVHSSEPAYTGAGQLPFRYILHAVGPVWGEGDEDRKLAAAVIGSLQLAERLGLHSLALPAISTGIFGFPVDRAAFVILNAIDQYLSGASSSLSLVKVVLRDRGTANIFVRVLESGSKG